MLDTHTQQEQTTRKQTAREVALAIWRKYAPTPLKELLPIDQPPHTLNFTAGNPFFAPTSDGQEDTGLVHIRLVNKTLPSYIARIGSDAFFYSPTQKRKMRGKGGGQFEDEGKGAAHKSAVQQHNAQVAANQLAAENYDKLKKAGIAAKAAHDKKQALAKKAVKKQAEPNNVATKPVGTKTTVEVTDKGSVEITTAGQGEHLHMVEGGKWELKKGENDAVASDTSQNTHSGTLVGSATYDGKTLQLEQNLDKTWQLRASYLEKGQPVEKVYKLGDPATTDVLNTTLQNYAVLSGNVEDNEAKGKMYELLLEADKRHSDLLPPGVPVKSEAYKEGEQMALPNFVDAKGNVIDVGRYDPGGQTFHEYQYSEQPVLDMYKEWGQNVVTQNERDAAAEYMGTMYGPINKYLRDGDVPPEFDREAEQNNFYADGSKGAATDDYNESYQWVDEERYQNGHDYPQQKEGESDTEYQARVSSWTTENALGMQEYIDQKRQEHVQEAEDQYIADAEEQWQDNNGSYPMDDVEYAIDGLNSMFDRPETVAPDNLLVFRKGELQEEDADAADNVWQVGEILRDDGFVSTSLETGMAATFSGTMFAVEVPKGSKAAYLDALSNGGEQELLLPAGSKFMRVGDYVHEKSQQTMPRLRYLGTEYDPNNPSGMPQIPDAPDPYEWRAEGQIESERVNKAGGHSGTSDADYQALLKASQEFEQAHPFPKNPKLHKAKFSLFSSTVRLVDKTGAGSKEIPDRFTWQRGDLRRTGQFIDKAELQPTPTMPVEKPTAPERSANRGTGMFGHTEMHKPAEWLSIAQFYRKDQTRGFHGRWVDEGRSKARASELATKPPLVGTPVGKSAKGWEDSGKRSTTGMITEAANVAIERVTAEWEAMSYPEKVLAVAGVKAADGREKYINPVTANATDEANIQDGSFIFNAAAAHMTVKEYAAQGQKHMEEMVANAKLVKRARLSTLEAIAESGRIKSQFESGTSEGYLNPTLRTLTEHHLFGHDILSTPNTERPIYGYLANDPDGESGRDNLSQYGEVDIVFKPSVRDRATYLMGDSLDTSESRVMSPAPVNKPNLRTYLHTRDILDIENIEDTSYLPYTEAQIHGGVSTADIDYVVLPEFTSQPGKRTVEEMKKKLDKAGIKWKVRRPPTERVMMDLFSNNEPTVNIEPPVLFYRPDQRRDRGRFADEGRARRPGQKRLVNKTQGAGATNTSKTARIDVGRYTETEMGLTPLDPAQRQLVRILSGNMAHFIDLQDIKDAAHSMGLAEAEAAVTEAMSSTDNAQWFSDMLEIAPHVRKMRGIQDDELEVEANLGVTPFRGKPKSQVEELAPYYESTRYKGWLQDVRSEAARIGVTVEDAVKSAGIWQGAIEPSASVWVRGSTEAVKLFAGSIAGEYNQDGVMIFTSQIDNGGALYTLPDIDEKDRDSAIASMKKVGIDGGRLTQERNGQYALEVVDMDGSMLDKVLEMAEEIGTQAFYTPGSGTLLFGGQDYTKRSRPHKGSGSTHNASKGGYTKVEQPSLLARALGGTV